MSKICLPNKLEVYTHINVDTFKLRHELLKNGKSGWALRNKFTLLTLSSKSVK